MGFVCSHCLLSLQSRDKKHDAALSHIGMTLSFITLIALHAKSMTIFTYFATITSFSKTWFSFFTKSVPERWNCCDQPTYHIKKNKRVSGRGNKRTDREKNQRCTEEEEIKQIQSKHQENQE